MPTRRLIERGHEGRPLFGIQAYVGAFGENGARRIKGAFKHELADRGMALLRGLLQEPLGLRRDADVELIGSGGWCWYWFSLIILQLIDC